MTSTDPNAARHDPWDARQALALLLPAFALAWPGPGSLLRHDFLPHATGAGAAALASLPAAAILLVRRRAPHVRGLYLLLAVLLVMAISVAAGGATDTFGSGRALLLAGTGLVLLLGGASLGARGRTVLAQGTVCLSILLVAAAFLDRENGLAGALGNTGALSEAALPGAIAGAFLALHNGSVSRWLGALALVLEAAFVARAPVLAGAGALAGALLLLAPARVGTKPTVRLVPALLAVLVVAAPFVFAPRSRTSSSTSGPGASSGLASVHAGGLEVRTRIWSSGLAMLKNEPLLGVGPGQFEACFPPYRDPREIELSSLSHALAAESQVEHAHNDWLGPVLEEGAVAGAAWIAFLLLIGLTAWRRVRTDDVTTAALSLAALGVLANAFADATLTGNAVSATVAFALFGCVLSDDEGARPPLARRLLVLGACALLVGVAPRAWSYVAHGRALASLAREGELDEAETERALDAALAARPDSPLALALRARLAEARGAKPEAVREAWHRVLALQPFRFEARMQLAWTYAEAGDPAHARVEYLRALALDPGHPVALRNLATAAFEDGDAATGLACLDRLAEHPPDRAWLAALADRLVLRGLDREAEALLRRVDPALADLPAEACWTRAKQEREARHDVAADAFECRAHRAWAREHAIAGRAADAVRSYRQCLRLTLDAIPGGAPRVRFELAAALLLAGREDEARAQVDGLRASPADWSALPDWAVERLRAAEWFGG